MPVVFFLDGNVRLDLITERLPKRVKRVHRVVSVLMITGFYVAYIISHATLMHKMGDVKSPSLGIPNSLFFIAALIGALLVVTLFPSLTTALPNWAFR